MTMPTPTTAASRTALPLGLVDHLSGCTAYPPRSLWIVSMAETPVSDGGRDSATATRRSTLSHWKSRWEKARLHRNSIKGYPTYPLVLSDLDHRMPGLSIGRRFAAPAHPQRRRWAGSRIYGILIKRPRHPSRFHMCRWANVRCPQRLGAFAY